MLGDVLVGLGGVGGLVVVVLVGLLGLLMPFSMYAAQKWTYRSSQALENLNRTFDELLVLTRQEVRRSPTDGLR